MHMGITLLVKTVATTLSIDLWPHHYGLHPTLFSQMWDHRNKYPGESAQCSTERVAEIHMSCCCDCYCLGTNATADYFLSPP